MTNRTENNSTLSRTITKHYIDVLTDLRKRQELCDATLVVAGTRMPIHRCVMSACSPYFRAAFTNNFFNEDKRELEVSDVSPEVMEQVVNYAYTTEIEINNDNVEKILPAADRFHMMELLVRCCDFLVAQLNHDNALGIYAYAKSYFCTNLEKRAHTFIAANITEIFTTSDEFLHLSIGELEELLGADELNIKNEEVVFRAIVRWIDFDPVCRQDAMPRLMKTIRLGMMSTKFFVESIKGHKYVKDNDECKPMVIKTIRFLYDLDIGGAKDNSQKNPLARPRLPHDLLFVVGGWSGGNPTDVVETYDTRADRWYVVPFHDTSPRSYHGTIALGYIIYVIGGFDGIKHFNGCRKLDLISKKWSEVAPMHCRRCYVSVATLNGRIYAMGGFDSIHRLNTAEVYTPLHNQWSLIAPMNHQRSDASATAFDDRVYICGGFNGQDCLKTAEYYSIGTDQWTLIQAMRYPRSGIGVIGYRGQVYAVGGFNGMQRQTTAEKYDHATNTWTSIPDMFVQRSNFAIEVIDDMLFVIGGFNGHTTIFTVECYDATQNEWYDATDMNVWRSALSACVVSGLPNIRDYLTPPTTAASASATALSAVPAINTEAGVSSSRSSSAMELN